MRPTFLLLSVLGLVGLLTGAPHRVAASSTRECLGCTNDSCSGACACFASFGTICNNRLNKNCGALGF